MIRNKRTLLLRTGFDGLEAIANNAKEVLSDLREQIVDPMPRKHAPLISTQQLCELTGFTTRRINNILIRNTHGLPEGVSPGKGKSRLWTIEEAVEWVKYSQLEYNKEVKTEGDRIVFREGRKGKVVLVAIFKGGSSKSSITCALAQAMSLKGLKVLLIDLDPQASATQMFGIAPDAEVSGEETVLPAFDDGIGGEFDLRSVIKQTYWHGIDIIPACTELYDAEFTIPAQVIQHQGYPFWEILNDKLDSVRSEYDIILMDTAPSLSYVGMNALVAADGILVPVTPAGLDFASSVSFWKLFTDLGKIMEKHGNTKVYDFVNVVKSRVKKNNLTPIVSRWIASAYKEYLLPIELPESGAVEKAGAEFSTIYDKYKPESSVESHKQYKAAFDELADYVHSVIQASWAEGEAVPEKRIGLEKISEGADN